MDAVILAGGRGKRLGFQNKALLELQGRSFLERILLQLTEFDQVFLSTNDAGIAAGYQVIAVNDVFKDCGPLGGLHAALKKSAAGWLFAISCDTPLFQRELAEYLRQYISAEYDAIIAVSRDGRVQPLCGFYQHALASLIEEQILAGNYRMLDLLSKIKVKYVSLAYSMFPDKILHNINAYKDYWELKRELEGPPVIAVCGGKNSGKTTLLAGIIPLLSAKGLRIAAIKHDGHDFDPDVPNTDSYRLRTAGAAKVAIYSSQRSMIAMEQSTSPQQLLPHFQDIDLVLLEGGKDSLYPKIEILRRDNSSELVSNKVNLIAICTDFPVASPLARFALEDYPEISEFIFAYVTNKIDKDACNCYSNYKF